MEDEKLQELLELYIDMVEKQDEIIYRMSKLLREYTREIQHLRNINAFFKEDTELSQDREILEECIEQYQEMKDID